MKKHAKRWLALLLILSMCLGQAQGVLAAQVQEPDTQTVQTEGTVSAEGSGDVQEMVAELFDDTLARESESAERACYISDLLISGQEAVVRYESAKAATVMVALYEEHTGRMLMMGRAAAPATEGLFEVRIAFDEALPEYFTAKVFLLDQETTAPLCERFSTDAYSEGEYLIRSASVSDFDQELVINLDEALDNNFAVFHEGTLRLNNEMTANSDGTYSIRDGECVQAGDTVAQQQPDGSWTLVKVRSIRMDGSTAVITEDPDAQLSDFFRVVKIEGGYRSLDEEEELALQGDDFQAEREIKKEFDKTEKASITEDGVTTELSIGVKGSIRVTAYVKVHIFDKTQSIEAKLTFKTAVSLDGNGKLNKEIPITEALTFSPVAGVYITFKPVLILSLSGKTAATLTFSAAFGFQWSSASGFSSASEAPKLVLEAKVEAEIYIGVSLEPEVKILSDKIASASLKGKAGGTITASSELKVGDGYQHQCAQCINGAITGSGSVSAKVSLANKVELSADIVTWKSRDSVEWHYCADENEFQLEPCKHMLYRLRVTAKRYDGSAYGSAEITIKGFDGTDFAAKTVKVDSKGKYEEFLPHGTYLLTMDGEETEVKLTAPTEETLKQGIHEISFEVWNEDREPVVGAAVTVSSRYLDEDDPAYQAEHLETDENGQVTVQLPGGYYQVEASKDELSAYKSITVSPKSDGKKIVLVLKENPEYHITLHVIDDEGKAVMGAKVRCEALPADLMTDTAGKAEFDLIPGTYSVHVEKDGLSADETVTVEKQDVEKTILLTKKLPVTVDVYVVNGDREPIEQAKVSCSALPDAVYTDESGAVRLTVEPGSWTIQASKDGMEASETVTIDGDRTITLVLDDRCKVIVSVLNEDGTPAVGAEITCSGLPTLMADADGQAQYLTEPGVWNFAASLDSLYANQTVEILGNTKISLQLEKQRTEYTFEDGVLTIWGNGPMTGWSEASIPWDAYRTEIQKVIILDGVTTICYIAFAGYPNLTEVQIPHSVKYIDDSAFEECIALKSLSIPYGVTSIGRGAFNYCTSLKEVDLPESLEKIDRGAFMACTSLERIELPDGLRVLGASAFSDCSALNMVILPDGLTHIGASAFSDCTALVEALIPDSVVDMGAQAFYNCTSMENVVIGKGLAYLEKYMFRYCSSLKTVTIPASVINCGTRPFEYCKNIEDVYYGGTREQWGDVYGFGIRARTVHFNSVP